MGVTAKDVGVCLWKVVKFTMKTFYYCVKRHPLVSCILLLFFLLYMFLPSVFTFLIYFSPLVIFTGVVHRAFLIIDGRKIKKTKEDEKKKNDGDSKNLANDTKGSSSSAETTARRRISKEGNKEDTASSTSVEDKDTVFSRSFNDDLVDKTTLAEEKPKEIREVKVDSVINKVECSSSSNASQQPSRSENADANGKGDTERESPDDTEDDDDEEEEQEERNKAVQWTEDDQKNLMDLGLSEIERNKRLESLIARRRSRKFMSLQGRRTMGSSNLNASHISSLQIPKYNPFLADSSSNISPIPGSAPSVLLPTSNPFDLPYDPFEEKPNLTGGSFHQEFMVPNNKDMVFCRHESFSMGAFLPPESKNVKLEMHHDFFTKQRIFERPPISRLDIKQDGKQIGQELPPVVVPTLEDDSASSDQGKEEEDSEASEQVVNSVDNDHGDDVSNVQTKELVVDDSSSTSSSSSSFEATEPIFKPNREAILNSLSRLSRRHISVDRLINLQINNNELHDSGPSDLDKRDSIPSDLDKRKSDEHFFHANMRIGHTPSHSIASDLQVEVSDVGSPPLTNISSQDEVSSTNDGDMEKENTSGSEEMWAGLSHLSGVDGNESRSREVHEVSEKDIKNAGFSKIGHKSDPHLSQVLPEKVVDSQSLSPSKPQLAEGTQPHTIISNQSDHEKDPASIVSAPFEAPSSEALVVPLTEKAQILTGELAATPSHDGVSVNPEESSSPKKFEKELNTSDSVNNHEVPVKKDTEDITTAGEVSSKAQASIQDKNMGSLSNHLDEANSESTESGGQLEKRLECLDSSKPNEKKDITTPLEEVEKGVQNLAQQEDVFEKSESTEKVGKPCQDREAEHFLSEHDISVVSQGLINHTASVSQNEVSTDQASSSTLDKDTHDEVQTSGTEMVPSNHLDEQDSAEGGAMQNLAQQKDVLGKSESTETVGKPSEDREVDSSRVAHCLLDPAASVSQNEVSSDQASLSTLDKDTHEEVQTSGTEMVPSNHLDEQDSAVGWAMQNLAQQKDVLGKSESTETVGKLSEGREVDSSGVTQGLIDPAASVSQHEVSVDQASNIEVAQTSNIEMGQNSYLDEQGNEEGEASQNLGDHMTSDVVGEQVRIASSLSSPKSVLQPTFSIDQASSPNVGEEIYTEIRSESGIGEPNSLHRLQQDNSAPREPEDAVNLNDISRDGPSHEKDSLEVKDSIYPSIKSSKEVHNTSIVDESFTDEMISKDKLFDSQTTSILEATAELLRSAKDTEVIIDKQSESPSAAPQPLPADQSGEGIFQITRQEEQCDPLPEWPIEELTINPTAYDSGSEIGERGLKYFGESSESASQSITRQGSVHHEFSQSSEDFIQDLFGSLVGNSASASSSVTRQSSVHEFSRSSEDFLQDLFKSLVSEAGPVSTRVSRQGSMLESTEGTEDMIQDLFKSLQDNPRE